MDVARIDAVSPRQIDWRKLTAKEIIKYDSQGIDVPVEYLQWAKQFRADISSGDKDDTTYEMATNPATIETNQPEPSIQISADTDNNSVNDDNTNDDNQNKTELTPAQQKREELQNSGVSLRNQAKSFTVDSKNASKSMLESAAIIASTQELSNNEIQALDGEMKELLSKAEAAQNELKSQVANINNSKNDKSAFAKINRLQKELERYGNEGQSNLAASESDFSSYDATLNAQTNGILNAKDFGSETVGVGNDLLTSIRGRFIWALYDYIIGQKAVQAGDRAVGLSESTSELQTQAISQNSDNKSQVAGYKNDVESKTGVAAVKESNKSEGKSSEQDDSSSDSSKASSDNTVTETDKAASGNLDAILKAKIRRGEDTQA